MKKVRYVLPLSKWRQPENYPVIVQEMKDAGFKFDSEPNGKYPLPLTEPVTLYQRGSPRTGEIIYEQTL